MSSEVDNILQKEGDGLIWHNVNGKTASATGSSSLKTLQIQYQNTEAKILLLDEMSPSTTANDETFLKITFSFHWIALITINLPM